MAKDSYSAGMDNRKHLHTRVSDWIHSGSGVMVDEPKAKEETEEEQPAEDTGEGDKSETTELIEQQSERIKELEAERDKRIMDDAKKQMRGTAEGGAKEPKKPKETDEEYSERVMRGEADPLKEDGFIR